MNKLYCCYSVSLRDFLRNHGMRYEICGLNPNNYQMFWAYIKRQWNYKSYYQYDLNFNLVKKWDSIIDAEKAGFKRESIYKCCKLHVPAYKGFIFRDYLINSNENGGDGLGCGKECREKSAS